MDGGREARRWRNGASQVAVDAGAGRRRMQRRAAVPGWLWRALTYFSLWSLRLGGWLPPLHVCVQSGVELEPDQPAYFERSQPGLVPGGVSHAGFVGDVA